MISVVSPAKSLDFDTSSGIKEFTQPAFLKESEVLINDLKKYSPVQLSALMKISDKLGALNTERYDEWETPFTLNNAKQAVFAFQGDVYQGLEIETFSKEDLKFAQSNFRILSGLYGVLKPLDLMQAYRLEMGTSFKNKNGRNLYDFWGASITEYLNRELKEQSSEVLLNLASNEYFKVIKSKQLNARIITPVFKDWKNGQYKIISFFAKKARGMMASYQLKNRINNHEDLKGFGAAGYLYNNDLSYGDDLVFTRKQE
jgi:uncharacterized protein